MGLKKSAIKVPFRRHLCGFAGRFYVSCLQMAKVFTYLGPKTEIAHSFSSSLNFSVKKSKFPGHFENTEPKPPGEIVQ